MTVLTTPEWSLWKKIHQTTAALLHTLQSKAPHLCKPPTLVVNLHSIPPLDLPYPHDILAPILTLNIPNEVRRDILQCLNRRISDIQKEYSTIYQKAYQDVSSWPSTTFEPSILRQLYQTTYHRNCLPMIQAQVSTLVHAVATRQELVTERRRAFNHEYIPLLETYFEQNAYPSALDRQLLAQKSMMSPRQIEVWFQNHRNRAKKDGKTLKRLTGSPSKLILESLERKMPHLIVPTAERAYAITDNSDDDSDEETIDTNRESEFVNFCLDASATFEDAPAFDRDFIQQPFNSPPLPWRRKPASSPIPAGKVDMDEFIGAFSALNIREGAPKKHRNRKSNRRTSFPWFAAMITVPCRAPHPALISRCTNSLYRPSTMSVVKPSAPCADPHPWSTSFGACTQDAASSRNGPSIPRRTPSTTPFSKYIQHSPSSSTLSSLSLRTPSLSSVASSQSRSSSYSSISSQDVPETPPPSVQPLDFTWDQDDFAALEALEAVFQGSSSKLDDLLSHNLVFDLPPIDLPKQMSITMPAVHSYSMPSYPPTYPMSTYSDDLNNLLFIPDSSFLQVPI